MSENIAVVGSGLVGKAWAITFARAGRHVELWDPDPAAAEATIATIPQLLANLETEGLLKGASAIDVGRRIVRATSLAEALAGAVHVQECAPEDVEVKRKLFAELDAATAANAVLASSSTAIMPSRFTADVIGRSRCIVAHPINPPYLVPAVEIVPAPWTDPAIVTRTRDLMVAIGQAPIVMQREIEGFLMNRLQAAVLQEAFRMVAEGLASVEDVDVGIRKGLGLRWAFIGPFETINLNAPGGVADYAGRYGDAMHRIAETQTQPLHWAGDLLKGVAKQLDQRTPPQDRAKRQMWRDRRLMALMRHLAEADEQFGV
ncbi:MAG TPA: 3-hydroxyacyl-CoA dehydrogenase [Bradyrhizobium sp.]|nr:3-hydroxyacyl-CoA dehydrogenase [Bradyrhizobium sp.]